MGAKRRTAQPQPVAVFSDYDTETAAPVPSDLPAPQWTVSSLNEAVMRRHVANLEKIERVAPFTVVYHFSPETQQWEKSGCEGTLFLCKMPEQRWSVVVLNRKSLDNFYLELVSGDDIELTSEYIILQRTKDDGVPEIIGLWVYDTENGQQSMKEIVGMAILEAANKAQIAREQVEPEQAYEEYVETQQMPQPTQASNGQAINITALFGRPQIQQETHISALPPSSGVTGQQLDLLKLFGTAQEQPNAHIHDAHYATGQPNGRYHV